MIISYATKRDTNGNRYLLIIDHNKRIYAVDAMHWYCKDDYIEISKTDRRRLLSVLESSDYIQVDRLTASISGI